MEQADGSLDQRLAEMAAQIRLDHVPDDVREAAIDCIIDTVAVALAGANDAASQSVSRVIDRRGPATVLGRAWASNPRDAALLNAVAAHVLDFDDWLPAAGLHPSAPIVAAALATAQAQLTPVSGPTFLTAYIAGFETQARIGAAIAPWHYEAGFHPTATVGAFGAATAAAHILKANAQEVASTLAVAAIGAAGLRAAFGTTGKSIQVGRAAENGVLAAQLVTAGATPPSDTVFGVGGFAAAHGHAVDEAAATEPFDAHWYLRDVAVKRHASCFGTHAPIDAILQLRDQISLDCIARVDVTVSTVMQTVCAIPSPTTPLEGKFSLAFTGALALARGQCAVADFTEESIVEPALLDAIELITIAYRSDVGPQHGQVRITLDDGTVHIAESDSAVPPSPAARGRIVREKLMGLATPVLGTSGAAELLEVIEGLAGDRSVSDLASALRPR